MEVSFLRHSGGIYTVELEDDCVGSVRKVSASKWILHDITDKPVLVSKSLKIIKESVENNKDNILSKLIDDEPEEQQYKFLTEDMIAAL